MTLPPALRLVLVSCRSCGRRNSIDLLVRLAGRRARCGACRAPLPWRLPLPLVVAVAGLAVLVAALVTASFGALGGRRDGEREARALEEARAGRVDETLALLAPLPEEQRAAVRAVLLETLVADLGREAGPSTADEEAVARAHGRADELIARHGETWPALVRALEPIVSDLRVRREVAQLAVPLRDEAGRSGADLDSFEARLVRALAEGRRLGEDAERRLAEDLRPAWDEAVLSAARGQARAGRPLAALATLQRPDPLPLPRSRRDSSPSLGAERPQAEGTPPAQVAALGAALRRRELDGLRRGVRVRADEAWSPEASRSLDELHPLVCRALASLAAEGAREAERPDERLALLLDAVTCDELLPPIFLEQSHAALAEARVAVAEGGGPLPPADALEGREALLARLACAAQRDREFGAAREALRRLPAGKALEAGLACGRWAVETPRATSASWPRLDYPLLPAGTGEGAP